MTTSVVDPYQVERCVPATLNDTDLDQCIALLSTGGALAAIPTKPHLRSANVVVLAKTEGDIVGLGVVKRVRPRYTADVCGEGKSGFRFLPDTPELGYIVVDPTHQRKKLSYRLVAELVNSGNDRLFSTTDSLPMKKALAGAGFIQRGKEWPGQRGQLSLWFKGKLIPTEIDEYFEKHLPYRIGILLAHYKMTRVSWTGDAAQLNACFIAALVTARLFLNLLGIGKTGTTLTAYSPQPDDVIANDLGGKLIDPATLSAGERDLLLGFIVMADKAAAHFTLPMEHDWTKTDEVIKLIHGYLRSNLYDPAGRTGLIELG